MAVVIKAAIRDAGLTARAVADAFEISEQAVSSWLRTGKIDKRKVPKLAQLTGKPMSYFGLDLDARVSEDRGTYGQPLSEKEIALLKVYRAGSAVEKNALDAMCVALTVRQGE